MKRIKGKASFIDLEMGFWGIIGEDGNNYRPVEMPEQLKKEGAHVVCWIKQQRNDASFAMWGIPVTIEGFETLSSIEHK